MTQPPPGTPPVPNPYEQGGMPADGAQPPAAPPPGYQAAPGGYPPPGAQPPPPPPGYAPPAGGYPPPGAQPPPGYPPAGYPAAPGQPAASNIQFDASKATTNDWAIIGSGLVLLIFSFFGWLTVDFGGFASYSFGAWHEYWWIATVLGLAVAVVFALRVLLSQPLPQIKGMFLALGAALGFVITLIALIENFATTGAGPGVGIWVCLIVSLAQTYLVWTTVQDEPGWTLPKFPKLLK